MHSSGESRKGVIRPDFNRSSIIDFMGATTTSDVGFLLMRDHITRDYAATWATAIQKRF